jgi:DNA-binding beta-propeller fold protein YncE
MTAYPGGKILDLIVSSGSVGAIPIAFNDQTTNTFPAIPSGGSHPRQVVIDDANTLFVTDESNNTVASLSYPYTGTAVAVGTGLAGARPLAIWP